MPVSTDIDGQFRFLISCIRHSVSGKVDFEEVRKECDIVSKGAAAKRYERLMKAHGISPAGASSAVKNEANDSESPKKKTRAQKKRKLEEVDPDETDIDEPVKKERGIKGEFKDEDATVKRECLNDDLPRTTPLHPLSSQSEPFPTDDDDEVLFVSATERQHTPNITISTSNDRRSQVHSFMPAFTGHHSVDCRANINFPQQLPTPTPSTALATMETMETTDPSNPFSLGFAPTAWVFPKERRGFP
ncbi:hypothetical protein F5Y01DRAFT_318488 [Xylaria sp. FL0043]|nr:hypothetical protein F5Y01DRAFT_318488 [Xylaria sp. FL0043]